MAVVSSRNLSFGGGLSIGNPAFNPDKLFLAGEQGVWYDPSDFSTLYQDTSGSTPVTTAGQPVGLMLDKSGNGFHAVAANNGAARPVLQSTGGLYYLDFDGVDDVMSTVSVDFTASDEMTAFVGVKKDTNGRTVFNTGYSSNGTLLLTSGTHISGGVDAWSSWSRGTSNSFASTASDFPVTNNYVITCKADISSDINIMNINGVQAVSSNTDQGSGNFRNGAILIGARELALALFNGRLYSLIVRGKTSTATEITNTEAWVADKTGVTL